MYLTSLTFSFLTVVKLDISFLSLHYETVDVNVYMYMYIRYCINTPLSMQNMRIFWAIPYSDEKEVESLVSDSKTDFNWTNDTFYVSVIL